MASLRAPPRALPFLVPKKGQSRRPRSACVGDTPPPPPPLLSPSSNVLSICKVLAWGGEAKGWKGRSRGGEGARRLSIILEVAAAGASDTGSFLSTSYLSLLASSFRLLLFLSLCPSSLFGHSGFVFPKCVPVLCLLLARAGNRVFLCIRFVRCSCERPNPEKDRCARFRTLCLSD